FHWLLALAKFLHPCGAELIISPVACLPRFRLFPPWRAPPRGGPSSFVTMCRPLGSPLLAQDRRPEHGRAGLGIGAHPGSPPRSGRGGDPKAQQGFLGHPFLGQRRAEPYRSL